MFHSKKGGIFDRVAKKTAIATGRPATFALALLILFLWALTGPFFNFNDTWQLVINTSTSIVTFLMVFLIQNMQNRDSQALQLKIDELIRATRGAHLALMDIEELTEEELKVIKARFTKLAEEGRESLNRGTDDTGSPCLVVDRFDENET